MKSGICDSLFKSVFVVGQFVLIASYIMMALFISDITYYKHLYFEGGSSLVQSRSSFGVYSGNYQNIKELYPDKYTMREIGILQAVFSSIMVIGFTGQIPAWIGLAFNSVVCLRLTAFLAVLTGLLSTSIVFIFESQARLIASISLLASIVISITAAILSDKLEWICCPDYLDEDDNRRNEDRERLKHIPKTLEPLKKSPRAASRVRFLD